MDMAQEGLLCPAVEILSFVSPGSMFVFNNLLLQNFLFDYYTYLTATFDTKCTSMSFI